MLSLFFRMEQSHRHSGFSAPSSEGELFYVP